MMTLIENIFLKDKDNYYFAHKFSLNESVVRENICFYYNSVYEEYLSEEINIQILGNKIFILKNIMIELV